MAADDSDPTATGKVMNFPRRPLRSLDDTTNASPSLLTLPPTDLPPPVGNGLGHPDRSAVGLAPDTAADDDDVDAFLLVQLPADGSLTVEDIISGRARFVGPSSGDISDEDDHDDFEEEAAAGTQRQACLVVEGSSSEAGGKSSALVRVETSNALILVPPLSSSSASSIDDGLPAAAKRRRVGDGPSGGGGGGKRPQAPPVEMPSRLIHTGGSGASFLEVRPHRLDRRVLRRALARYAHDPHGEGLEDGGGVKNPYATVVALREKRGRTEADLAGLLRCSRQEVASALRAVGAFELPPVGSGRYGSLTEEGLQDGMEAVVAALSEVDILTEAFVEGKNFEVSLLVKEAKARSGGLEECVVRHCARRCCTAATEGWGKDGGTACIDPDKIAVFLAHQIFAKTSCKSIEESDFISEWQGLIPGSGMSAPSVDLLQGVALREDGQNDGGGGKIGMEKTSHLSHFSESSLPLGPSDRLMKMFRLRDRWTIEEMAPYLNPLVEECGMSTTKMLLRYAKVVTDESGVQWYMAQKILS